MARGVRARLGGVGHAAVGFMTAVLAVVTSAWLMWSEPRGVRGLDTTLVVREGTHTWLVQRADALGMTWICAERGRDLAVPQGDLGATPTPLELSSERLRAGVLEVGWPAPMVEWRFTIADQDALFPPSVEVSDAASVLQEAWRRACVGEGERSFLTSRIVGVLTAALAPLTLVVWWALARVSRRAGSE
jgi:hypothetical protein